MIVIPDELLQAAKMSEAELIQEIAVVLFQQERLTLAQASRFAGLPRIEFQRLLASRKIPVHYDVPEFEANLKTMQEMGYL